MGTCWRRFLAEEKSYRPASERPCRARHNLPYGAMRAKSESPSRNGDSTNSNEEKLLTKDSESDKGINDPAIERSSITGSSDPSSITNKRTARSLSNTPRITQRERRQKDEDPLGTSQSASERGHEKEGEHSSDEERQKYHNESKKKRSTGGQSGVHGLPLSSPPRARSRNASGKGSDYNATSIPASDHVHSMGLGKGERKGGFYTADGQSRRGTNGKSNDHLDVPINQPSHTPPRPQNLESVGRKDADGEDPEYTCWFGKEDNIQNSQKTIPQQMTTDYYVIFKGDSTPTGARSRDHSMDKRSDREIIRDLQDALRRTTDNAAAALSQSKLEYDQQLSIKDTEAARLHSLMRDARDRQQQKDLLYETLEGEVVSQKESIRLLRNDGGRLRNQESHYAEQAKNTAEALFTARSEAWEYTTQVKKEFDAKESTLKSLLAKAKADAQTGKGTNDIIEKMNEDAAQQKLEHTKAIEEMAVSSAQELKPSMQAAEDQAKYKADEARQDRLTLTQELESKLQLERQKANSAVKEAIDAEDKLKEEKELVTMKYGFAKILKP